MIKIKLISLLAAIITLVLLLGLTSPVNAPLSIYLAVFFVAYWLCFICIILIIDLAYSQVPRKMRIFTATVLSFSPTILLALASLSSISITDLLLAIGVPAAIVWYGLKSTVVK